MKTQLKTLNECPYLRMWMCILYIPENYKPNRGIVL